MTTIALPAPQKTALRAGEILAAWAADEDMPTAEGSVLDAVRVLAIRAAVLESTGDEALASLPAPAAVELSAVMLLSTIPEMTEVIERSGHRAVLGSRESIWRPGDFLHQVFRGAFGPVTGLFWPV